MGSAPHDRLTEVLLAGQRLGFLGPGAVSAHRSHARVYVAAGRSAPRRALDLGSGGGVPGLILASAPEWGRTQWALLDAAERRCRFLIRAAEALELQDRVVVLHGRAEELGRRPDLRGSFDLVVARSFAPPAVVAECAAPFLAVGGQLIVSEPPVAANDPVANDPASVRWPSEPLATLGLAPRGRVALPQGTVMVLQQRHRCGDAFPRRVGRPTRAPLYRVHG